MQPSVCFKKKATYGAQPATYYFCNYNNIKMDINIDDTIDSILDFGVSERTGLTKFVQWFVQWYWWRMLNVLVTNISALSPIFSTFQQHWVTHQYCSRCCAKNISELDCFARIYTSCIAYSSLVEFLCALIYQNFHFFGRKYL